ncbi:MAG TPA: G1 family glutamic endopeptidase [Mycobacteriales bacterium]|nr:G1 family glutamic endopeptidase [Mycobacteriales bacterium]
MRWCRAWLVLVCVGALLAAGSAPASAATEGYSGAWSGLVSGGGGYVSVSAEVTVPKVTAYCGKDSNVVAYVGLGGWGSLPFAQNGFTVTPSGLGAWYEVFDRAGRGTTVGVPLPIRPGDRVRLSLAFSTDRTVLRFHWENLTQHRVVARQIGNAARYYNGATADYVVERAWYPYRGAPLARFTPVIFRNAKAIRGGHWLPAVNPRTIRVTMLGATARPIALVSAAAGTSFQTSWAGCR